MSCLSLSVLKSFVHDLRVGIIGKTSSVGVAVSALACAVGITTECQRGASVSVRPDIVAVGVGTSCQNTSVSISMGLVCPVGLGKYEAFYVTEGAFIVENGYFRVKKV